MATPSDGVARRESGSFGAVFFLCHSGENQVPSQNGPFCGLKHTVSCPDMVHITVRNSPYRMLKRAVQQHVGEHVATLWSVNR